MSCIGPRYNPQPPRAWSRVEAPCAYTTDFSSDVYVPLANTTMKSAYYAVDYQPGFLKANVLQYKCNSANLTSQQRYSKIARGQWTNRTKTWATQSQTYTNANTASLRRVNVQRFVPKPSGYVSPFGCASDGTTTLEDGGTLVGTQTVDPCSGEIIKTTFNESCNLSTDCDVPGAPIALCWDDKVQPWYPRVRRVMSTSGNKWPVNYKFLVSANGIAAANRGGVGSY